MQKMYKFARVILFFFSNWNNTYCEDVANTVNALETYQDLIKNLQSDEFIKKQITSGEHYAQKYLSPEFIHNIVNADKIQAQAQQAFNQTLIIDTSPSIAGYTIPIGIYYGDIFRLTNLGCAWGFEWLLYNSLKQFTISNLTETIIENITDDQTTLQKNIIPPLHKNIILTLLLHACSTSMLAAINTHFLLDTYTGKHITLPGLWSVVPQSTNIHQHLNPSYIITMVNSFFKTMGWMPSWSDSLRYHISKEFIALVLWYAWHHYHCRQLINVHLMDQEHHIHTLLKRIKQKDISKEEHTEIKQMITAFIQTTLYESLSTWIVRKTMQLTLWHSIANIVVATPAWYKIGKWAFDTYSTIYSPSTQSEAI